jgi:hypothetical protein
MVMQTGYENRVYGRRYCRAQKAGAPALAAARCSAISVRYSSQLRM